MHELSIALSMIDRITEECESRGGLHVEAVHLRLGVLSGVDRDALTFSYEIACQGTFLEGSRLVIETVPLLMYCPVCEEEHVPESLQQLCCPRGHTSAQDVIRGKDLEVAALEIAA